MSLVEFVAVLRRGWVPLVFALILGGVIGFAVATLPGVKYAATSQLFVATTASASSAELAAGSNYLRLQIKSYPELLRTQAVLNGAVRDARAEISPAELARSMTVAIPVDTTWLSIKVTGTQAREVRRLSTAVANRGKVAIEDVEKRGAESSPVVVTVIEAPEAVPLSPPSMLYAAGGAIGAASVMLALLVLRWALRSEPTARRRRNLAPGALGPNDRATDNVADA